MRKITAFLALASAGAASLTAVPAIAADEPRRISVEHRDLNLNSPQGVATLKSRIDAAARRVCGTPSYPVKEEVRSMRQCRAEAASGALRWSTVTHEG